MLSELPTPFHATGCPLPEIQTSLPFANAPVALLQNGAASPLFLAVPFSSTGRSHLFAIELPKGHATKIPLEDAGAGVVAGPDGAAYLGTRSGRLLRFDPQQQTLTELTPPFSGEEFIAGFTSASGLIYFGSTPGGIVAEYDPACEKLAHYLYWRSDNQHPQHARAFADLPDGRVVAFLDGLRHETLLITPGADQWERGEISSLHGERAVWQVVPLDAESLLVCTMPGRRLFRLCARTLQVIDPVAPLPGDDAVSALQRAGDDIIASGISGTIYRYAPRGWEALGTPIPHDPMTFTAFADGRLVGITYQGRLAQSTQDQRVYTIFPLPTKEIGGLAIQAMGMSPDRKLYFSFARNMRLGSWNPDDEEELSERFVAAPFPGEVSALGFAGERLFIGCADCCGVMAYYPELPYRLMENPRLLGIAGEEQRRPIGPMVHHESNVYFAAAAVSDRADGAIVRLNPLDNVLMAFDDIIPGQNLTSLVADRLSGLLVAGGECHAGGAETAEVARLAFWSPYRQETVRLVTPFPEATKLRVWAAEGGRIYVTDGGARLAVLSSEGELLETLEFSLGAITTLITNQDGQLYGLAGGWMFHLDAEKRTVSRLTEATGHLLVEVRRGLFAYADGGHIHTVQLW